MRIALLSFLLTGCSTFQYPQVTTDTIEACKKLCRRSGGLEAVQTNVHVDMLLRFKTASELCLCKNQSAFTIGSVKNTTP